MIFSPYFQDLRVGIEPPVTAKRLGKSIDPSGDHQILYLDGLKEAIVWNARTRAVYCDHVNDPVVLEDFLVSVRPPGWNFLCPRCAEPGEEEEEEEEDDDEEEERE